jgi:hypothetical protein
VGKLPGVPSYGLKWSYAGNRRGGLVASLHRNRGEMGRGIGAWAWCAKERKGGGGPSDNWSWGSRHNRWPVVDGTSGALQGGLVWGR